MKPTLIAVSISLLAVCLFANAQEKTVQKTKTSNSKTANKIDADLVADLKLIQGSWELQHGGKNRPTTRSVKTIKGNIETLKRYNNKTGKKTHEHSVEIKLSKSGAVRVCTFFRVGGTPENGLSFVYRLDTENYYDIPGLLQGSDYRNYGDTPKVWHWKRIKEDAASDSKS